MHDKVVRRRRAVLALLVIVSIVLLTDYFGESSSSPLHSVQRGIVAVLSPVQDGASKALSPVRNVSDWVSSTLNAKSQRDQYKADYEQAERQLAVAQRKNEQAGPAARELGLDEQLGINEYDPVSASVIGRNESLWYQQVEVNAGSGAGVAVNDPVVADGALVGRVSLVNGSSSEITLITDHTVNVAAQVQDTNGDSGVLEPDVGNPNALLLTELPNHAAIAPGQLVVTAGFSDPSDSSQSGSLYPPAIPIGHVAQFTQNTLLNRGQVPVTPLASIRRFTSVQILTKPYGTAAPRRPTRRRAPRRVRVDRSPDQADRPHRDPAADHGGRPGGRDLTDLAVRRQCRRHGARRHLGGAADRLAAGRDRRLLHRAAGRHGARPDARRDLAALHHDRLLGGPPA